MELHHLEVNLKMIRSGTFSLASCSFLIIEAAPQCRRRARTSSRSSSDMTPRNVWALHTALARLKSMPGLKELNGNVNNNNNKNIYNHNKNI